MADKLYVPANISTEKELWNGFGIKQAAVSAAVTAAAAALAFGYVKLINPNGLTKAVFSVMLACAASISLQTRIENNMSVVDYLKIMIKFGREQQEFKFSKKKQNVDYIIYDREDAKCQKQSRR